MSVKSSSNVDRRYVRRLAVATAGYLLTLAVATRFVGSGAVSGPAAYALAAFPALCVMGLFWAYARLLIEETDEYRRLLLVRQSLVATGFTLSIVTLWGFLQNFGLVGQIDAFYYAALWFVGLGIGAAYNRVTLGDDAART